VCVAEQLQHTSAYACMLTRMLAYAQVLRGACCRAVAAAYTSSLRPHTLVA
jgi:hypothetical protein